MALYGSIETIHAQVFPRGVFDIALKYLREVTVAGTDANKRLMAMEAGKSARVELEGGVYASEQAYVTKPVAEGKWESHKKYIDWQVVVSGSENMDVCDVKLLTVAEDQSETNDLLFYKPYAEGSLLRVRAGEGAMFFPVDAHRPCLQIDALPTIVHKTVVKIPVK